MKRLALACVLALTACTSTPQPKLIDAAPEATAREEITLPPMGNPRPKLQPDVARERAADS